MVFVGDDNMTSIVKHSDLELICTNVLYDWAMYGRKTNNGGETNQTQEAIHAH